MDPGVDRSRVTSSSRTDVAARLLRLWRRLSPLPGGRTVFSWLLGRQVPYSGTTGARIERLDPGRVEVSLRDRRRVRNHLDSIHAVALTNVGELASGLALLTALPPGVRSIVIRLETRFHHKARGRLVASCRVDPAPVVDETDREVRADIHDAEGRRVAEVRALWRLRPEGP